MPLPELDRTKWTPDEQAQFATKGWRHRRPGEFPPCMATIRPADYKDDFHRGTVEWSEEWKNYSYHTVLMPEGVLVRFCNFTQADPKTPALVPANVGGKITVKDCNLCNVAGSKDLTVTNCNMVQGWLVESTDPGTGDVLIERTFLASSPGAVTGTPTKPPNAVKPFDAAAVAPSGMVGGDVGAPGIFT